MSQANQTIFNNLKPAIESKVRLIVPPILQHQIYDPNKTKEFATQICQQVVKELTNLNKNFKYITNCTIVGANGNGLDMTGVYYWDNQMDGFLTYKWEGKYLICIVNIYGCAMG